MVDPQREVQREISLHAGGDVTGLCWAGDTLLACRRGPSTEGVLAWSRDGAGSASVLPDSQSASDFTCLEATPCGSLVAAGQSDGQVGACMSNSSLSVCVTRSATHPTPS